VDAAACALRATFSAARREVNSRLAARRAHRSSAGHSETARVAAQRIL